LLRQNAEFIVDVQPVAFFSLIAMLAPLVRGVENQIVRALLAIQISQQHYAWICECLNDSSPHGRLPKPFSMQSY
jgi:hypothetical protein